MCNGSSPPQRSVERSACRITDCLNVAKTFHRVEYQSLIVLNEYLKILSRRLFLQRYYLNGLPKRVRIYLWEGCIS